jgi:hypothetical protein
VGVDGFGVFDELEKYFSHQQLAAIESAFEQRDMFEYEDHAKMSDAEMVWSQDFTRGAKTPADRLRAIMNNIIENKVSSSHEDHDAGPKPGRVLPGHRVNCHWRLARRCSHPRHL